MLIDESHLQQITIDVCQAMLGLTLSPSRPDLDDASPMVASVEIMGQRHSVIEVFAPDKLMTAIAEVMFDADGATLSEEEIRDAFGEVANMIGGNVKGGYGDGANLSLPIVSRARDWLAHLPHGCLRTTFECCGHTLTIIVRDVKAMLLPKIEPALV